MKPYIKDLRTGNIRPYGSNHHDSLLISQDGTYLTYEHLQCGDGSIAGDKENSGFVFCDDEGHTPEEDETLCRYGADAYFNIGGWDSLIDVLQEIRQEIENNMETITGTYDASTPEYNMPSHKIERNFGRKECIAIINKHIKEIEG